MEVKIACFKLLRVVVSTVTDVNVVLRSIETFDGYLSHQEHECAHSFSSFLL